MTTQLPTALLRQAYEAERDAWQSDLARLQARMRANQEIAAKLGTKNQEHIDQIARDMEAVAIGLAAIEALIAGLDAQAPAESSAATAAPRR